MASKKEIVDKLVELKIEHDESASKADLEALLPAGSLPESEAEDAPHRGLREIIAAYKLKNPTKYEAKKASFEKKLAGKLEFGRAPDGSLLDGRIDPVTQKRIPLEVVEVK